MILISGEETAWNNRDYDIAYFKLIYESLNIYVFLIMSVLICIVVPDNLHSFI